MKKKTIQNYPYTENEKRVIEAVAQCFIAKAKGIKNNKNRVFLGKPPSLEKIYPLRDIDPILFHFLSSFINHADMVLELKVATGKIVGILVKAKDKNRYIEVTKEMRNKSRLFGDSPESKLLQEKIAVDLPLDNEIEEMLK